MCVKLHNNTEEIYQFLRNYYCVPKDKSLAEWEFLPKSWSKIIKLLSEYKQTL